MIKKAPMPVSSAAITLLGILLIIIVLLKSIGQNLYLHQFGERVVIQPATEMTSYSSNDDSGKMLEIPIHFITAKGGDYKTSRHIRSDSELAKDIISHRPVIVDVDSNDPSQFVLEKVMPYNDIGFLWVALLVFIIMAFQYRKSRFIYTFKKGLRHFLKESTKQSYSTAQK